MEGLEKEELLNVSKHTRQRDYPMKSKERRNDRKIEEQEEWELEHRQIAWDLYLSGKGWKEIAAACEHTIHEAEQEVRKINSNYRPHGSRRKVKGKPRVGRWNKREVKSLRRLKENKTPLKRMVELLGRPEEEITKQLNPRQGHNTFGLI